MKALSSSELLVQWCRFGWAYRGLGKRPQKEQDWYAGRVKYELGLITEKDFQDVFLVVSDAIRWAKDHDIVVGPGRGSVAASVVAWLLRIHEVDPYQHPGLLFERFLDSSRADPPDIDTDFEDERRWEVREYLEGKYGRACVGQVGNFIRYRGKNALVDVARVYRVPTQAKEAVSSLVIERSGGDSRFDATLEDTIEMFPQAKAAVEAFPDLLKATRLEGNVRGMSVHAAGLVVANGPLTDICSIYERDGVQVMSLDKYDVEDAGAIKLDFLGLTTMSIIARTLEATGMTLNDLYNLPLDDEEVLAAFRAADVVGVFQFEGRATRLITRDVQARNFTELSDVNALSRPGPLFSGTTATYIDVRHGRKKAAKLHPLVDEVTSRTKGQIIYQEQILQILRDLGGFDWFSVGQIRRIISKKVGEAAFQMSEDKFLEGAERLHGMDRKLADRIWKLMVTSGTYSFVTAHSVSYTLIGYWCMWLKVHHPVEFLAAALSKTGDEEQQYKLMRDAMAHGIEIVPPRLNLSGKSWRPVPDVGIVAGWMQIPGIGEKTANTIVADKQEFGNYEDWGQLEQIKGIGPKTVQTMQAFAVADDPFGLRITGERMDKVNKWLRDQRRIPRPTHDGSELAMIPVEESFGGAFVKGPRVVYAGIVRERAYQDAIENARSRSGKEIDEITREMKRPDLKSYCSLRCYDKSEEEVYLRVSRWIFPRLKRTVDGIAVNHDVVIAEGNRIAGFGTPVMVDKLYVVDPD